MTDGNCVCSLWLDGGCEKLIFIVLRQMEPICLFVISVVEDLACDWL